jgi:hypothetical protein
VEREKERERERETDRERGKTGISPCENKCSFYVLLKQSVHTTTALLLRVKFRSFYTIIRIAVYNVKKVILRFLVMFPTFVNTKFHITAYKCNQVYVLCRSTCTAVNLSPPFELYILRKQNI